MKTKRSSHSRRRRSSIKRSKRGRGATPPTCSGCICSACGHYNPVIQYV